MKKCFLIICVLISMTPVFCKWEYVESDDYGHDDYYINGDYYQLYTDKFIWFYNGYSQFSNGFLGFGEFGKDIKEETYTAVIHIKDQNGHETTYSLPGETNTNGIAWSCTVKIDSETTNKMADIFKKNSKVSVTVDFGGFRNKKSYNYGWVDCSNFKASINCIKNGCNYDDGKITKQGNCSNYGIKTYTCTVCGSIYTKETSKGDHIWSDNTVIKQATCTEDGVCRVTCKICGKTQDKVIVASHQFDDEGTVVKTATCTARGIQRFVCKVCGEEVSRPIDALGHKWVLTSKKEATCTEAGIENYKCSTCGATGKKDIDKTAHVFKLIENVKPTCDKEGKKMTKCSECGLEVTDIIPATGHKVEFGMCIFCGFDFEDYYKPFSVGGVGQAGGFIFYDCDADNDNGNKDGLKSYECGWRFLEAAQTDLPMKYMWGDDGNFGTKEGIGEGKNNTKIIVEKASKERKENAANACETYSVNGYSDWFLPSLNELNMMYDNLKKKGIGNFHDSYFCSSIDADSFYYALRYDFDHGNSHYEDREASMYVRPCRAF